MIDTVILCGNSGYDVDIDHNADSSKPKFQTLKEKLLARAYLNSIEDKIKEIGESDVPYFLVAGHFPVFFFLLLRPTQD
jgi:hypothetical protein